MGSYGMVSDQNDNRGEPAGPPNDNITAISPISYPLLPVQDAEQSTSGPIAVIEDPDNDQSSIRTWYTTSEHTSSDKAEPQDLVAANKRKRSSSPDSEKHVSKALKTITPGKRVPVPEAITPPRRPQDIPAAAVAAAGPSTASPTTREILVPTSWRCWFWKSPLLCAGPEHIRLHDNADIILIFPATSTPTRNSPIHIHCSAAILHQWVQKNSPWEPKFNRKNWSTFSRTLTEYLPQDADIEAWLFVLKALHLKDTSLPLRLSFNEAVAVAQVCRGLGIAQRFGKDYVFARTAHLLDPDDVDYDGKEEWVFVTMAFALKREFLDICRHLITHYESIAPETEEQQETQHEVQHDEFHEKIRTMVVHFLDNFPSLPLFEDTVRLAPRITVARTAILEKVLTQIHKWQVYMLSPSFAAVERISEEEAAAMCGRFLRSMAAVGLPPATPPVETLGFSIREIEERVRDVGEGLAVVGIRGAVLMVLKEAVSEALAELGTWFDEMYMAC